LAVANGVADRVIVHHADARTLAPAEPVDLIVSDFLGRLVVDDDMLDVVAAARAWLRPGGRCCPSAVRLLVAPVAIGHFAPLDLWAAPLHGLDLTPATPFAENFGYGAQLSPSALLAPPAELHTLDPTAAPAPIDRPLAFTFTAPGRLRGLAGWFDAQLAPGVSLCNAPGVETHWHQYLLPLPAAQVLAGDRLQVRLWLDADQQWRWEGVLTRAGRPDLPVARETAQRLDTRAPGPPRPAPAEPLAELNTRGALALVDANLGLATAAFEAATRALAPADDARAASVYENLGLAYVNTGRHAEAIPCFLRALDGDLSARPQSATLLVDACFRSGRQADGQRLLAEYEATYGPHPSGWRRT
jgi:hypothetical protein